MPKISVVIPVYNVEKYLKECLDSIINQTLTDIEIICVNDGSTDNSLKILEEYQQKDLRIKIISSEHKGAGYSRNLGIAHAQGEYLSLLDSDDFFDLNMFKDMYEQAFENKADISICQAFYYDNIAQKRGKSFGFDEKVIPDKKFFSMTDIEKYYADIFLSVAWNKIFKTNFIKENHIQFQELKTCNDIGFVFCAIAVAKRIVAIPKKYIFYRINTKEAITYTRGKYAINIIKAYLFIYNFLKERNLTCFIKYLNKNIKNNIRYEISHCNEKEFQAFKKEARLLLNDNWKFFQKSFEQKHMKYYQYLFSIKNSNDKKYKIITILGISIKIRRKNNAKGINNNTCL